MIAVRISKGPGPCDIRAYVISWRASFLPGLRACCRAQYRNVGLREMKRTVDFSAKSDR